ncbi:MAG: PKD domain-containing protein [Solirubrobacteraceae bacterium]
MAVVTGALGALGAAGLESPTLAAAPARAPVPATAALAQALPAPARSPVPVGAAPAQALTAAGRSPLPARAAESSPPQARLRVAARNPRQFVGVLFDASGSTGDIAGYSFNYGDGIVDSSYQPLALHGYRNVGTYQATVGVIDRRGQKSVSARVTIHVRDGVPPVVRIDSPRPNQRVRLGKHGLLLKGRASDQHGVRKVAIAVELVASKRHFNRHGGCIWYGGRRFLVLTPCGAPYYFLVRFAGGHWRFRIPARAVIPAGTYVVRVAATDRAGNVSHFFTVALRTILPFRLAR